MAVNIDKRAVVHKNAELGENCNIGPYCTIADNVRIGDGTRLRAHAYVDEHTSIGSDCDVFPYVREFVSVHAGTEEGTETRVGSDCALLAHSHVAHNCQVGNHVVLSHSATLAGYVICDDYANLGGLSAVHQSCHVGRAAMVAGMSRVIQDVLPFTIAEGFPAHMRIVNKIGMERAGYSAEAIADVRKSFRILFFTPMRRMLR